MIFRSWSLLLLLVFVVIVECVHSTSAAEEPRRTLIEPSMIHLRNKPEREWSDFLAVAERSRLSQAFSATANTAESCLMLRQVDVKEPWSVVLNGKRLGELTRDENDMTVAFPVPPGSLKNGDNLLVVEASSPKSPADDIRVGSIAIHNRPMADVLSDSTLEVTVTDEESREALPSRITIVDTNGSLVPFGTKSDQQLAIRAGTVYTANGHATVKLPAGTYTVYAGRGFEYSLAQANAIATVGEKRRLELSIRREVPTSGYVACDTHLHTLTHSGHGDATIEERMITLAGEGIELPIATDHNVHIDYEPVARKLGVRKYFTPVMGNEVTTARGHFNIFPIQADAKVVDHKQEWSPLFDEIYQTPDVQVAILNHARDLHSGVRPFGPALYNSVVAENLEGWPLRFNAMEVVNSGATQTDVLQLFHDWMGLLNHGHDVTPVGSSDSHDVARFIPGQGRTYIRCDDRDPGDLAVKDAIKNFHSGHVTVSYGLFVEMTVDDRWGPGDLAPATDHPAKVNVRVLGPHWVNADRIMLFANGSVIREQKVVNDRNSRRERGVIWQGEWEVDRRKQDQQLVAIAMGPGINQPYWRTAKPYQPTSIDPTTHVIGCSGAICLDQGDDQRMSPRSYAERLVEGAKGNIDELLVQLVDYDEATAAHVAHRLRTSGVTLTENQLAYAQQIPWMKSGFEQYREACKANDIARATIKP